MLWYQNPVLAAVLGGLAGAVVTGLVSLFIWRRTHKVKRVDCVINDVSSLLSFSDKIKDQLEIKFAGSQAKSVYLFSLDVLNSGTEAVTRQPVQVRFAEGTTIVDYTIDTEPQVGFGEVNELQNSGNALDLEVALMNPGDRLSLEIVSIDNPSGEVNVYMKNANVQSRVYSRKSAESALFGMVSDRQMMVLALLSSLPLFGGFARSLINVALAQRIDKIARRGQQDAK